MNKKHLIIELILGVVVLWLVIDQVTEPKIDNAEPEAKQKKVKQYAEKLKVAYINTDSLIVNYKLAQNLNKQFTEQQKQSEKELRQRMEQFEKDYRAFQGKVERGGFLLQSSAEAQQQELLREQQEIEQMNQQLNRGLMAEEQKITRELYDSISNFVKHYNKTRNYDLILNNTMGGSLIYGKRKYNITEEVLTGLNKRYDKRMQE